MNKEELMWLSKHIKDVKIMKKISERSDDFVETLMNYINLCSGNVNMDVINKMVEAESDKKTELIARVASNSSFMLSKTRTYEEKMILLDKIRDASTDFNAEHISKLTYGLSVNKRRTFLEQTILIDKIDSIKDDEELSKIIYTISTNNQILKRRLFDEQLKIINLLKKADTDFKKIYMQSVSINDFILKNYSSAQQIEFLIKISETNTDTKTFIVSNYINLGIRKRNYYEQLKVIEQITKAASDNIASYIGHIASNPNLVISLSSENHKKLLERINLAQTDEKARCMSLAILNQYRLTNEDIEHILKIMESIDGLDTELKVSCVDDFITKSDLFFKSNYHEQNILINLVDNSEESILNDYIRLLEDSNIPAKIVLSSKEFSCIKMGKETLRDNMEKYCESSQKKKAKSLFKKIN